MLTQLVHTLRSAGIDFALADVRQPVIDMARRAGLLDELGSNRIFHTIDEAVDALANAPRGSPEDPVHDVTVR
jgi:hypothetical protein